VQWFGKNPDCFNLVNAAIPFAAVFSGASGSNFISPTNRLKEIEMNASKILAAAALSLLAAAGAQAETYDGVHTVNSSVSRAEVAPQAVAAARVGNEYSDGASAGAQAFTSTADRATIQAEAVAKAHDPFASLDRRAFYRDEVPQAYKKPSVSFTRQAGL
jgi:mitochondrial fission protein ELM1